MQIVGKIRLSKSPVINHSWGSTLYVTSRGLTTSVIHEDFRSFSIDFDFRRHALCVSSSDGAQVELPLIAEPVAVFHGKCLSALRNMNIAALIDEHPNELPDALPFPEDMEHHAYDPAQANCLWRAMLHADRVMKEFRSRFVGKCSPVHFFWGSFDLAVTRFSGRRAPEHPGGVQHLPDRVAKEAYSHEVSSCGFWPGNKAVPFPAFYSYAYPEPQGFRDALIAPKGAYYEPALREFILPYDRVRNAREPNALLMRFFESTYEAAANLGKWDRALLEESPYLRLLQKKAA